jgi:hypothetical protein
MRVALKQGDALRSNPNEKRIDNTSITTKHDVKLEITT